MMKTEDLKLQLSATEYGNFLANVPSPISTSIISEKAVEKLVDEFNYLRSQAVGDFAKFFDYITYSYQIDNVVLLITGTLHERDTHELLERCHPLGWFNSLPALCVATTVEELYNSVLIETPLAPYFKDCLSAAELDELNIEIIRNTLYKAYLEDFQNFCSRLPSPTSTIMEEILAFEADRRAINITVNSFGTDLSKDERAKLYPLMGRLYPNGTMAMQRAEDVEGVKLACDSVVEYRPFFEQTSQGGGMQKSLEDHFFEREAQLNKLAFLQQVPCQSGGGY
jgi:V-type H+-transporting ATPase subunit d